jgi:hypothetical protein
VCSEFCHGVPAGWEPLSRRQRRSSSEATPLAAPPPVPWRFFPSRLSRLTMPTAAFGSTCRTDAEAGTQGTMAPLRPAGAPRPGAGCARCAWAALGVVAAVLCVQLVRPPNSSNGLHPCCLHPPRLRAPRRSHGLPSCVPSRCAGRRLLVQSGPRLREPPPARRPRLTRPAPRPPAQVTANIFCCREVPWGKVRPKFVRPKFVRPKSQGRPAQPREGEGREGWSVR